MKKNVTIICAGEDFNEDKIRRHCMGNYVIAVDGGLNFLNDLSIMPDYFIGDLDSIRDGLIEEYPGLKKEITRREKDLTDSELALRYALKSEPDEIFILAGTGSYLDHSLANIINLFRNYSETTRIKLITVNSEIFIVKSELILENLQGRRFSFFPFDNAGGLYMQGCKYYFDRDRELSGLDYSVSNIITEKKAVFRINRGSLIFVLFDENFL